MDRRKFLKTSALSSVALGMGTPLAFGTNDVNKIINTLAHNRIIDPVVPFRYYPKEDATMIAQLIEMKEKYGLRKFLLTAPMDEIKLQGYPSNEVYQNIGKQVLYLKEKLSKYDIEIGWWCAPSIRSGPNGNFQYITDLSGKVADASPCPLDPRFKEDFSNNVATVVKIARPFRIQFEDDYELSWQPPNVSFGCFCPLHLAEFSKRQNKEYTREQLLEIFKTESDESIRLRKAWAELSKDTMVAFATRIREKVDKVAPETSICLCQAGCSDLDGNFTEEVARAFAGGNRPVVRLFGSNYGNDNLISLPGTIFHALYSKQHLPSNFECLHETDSYPHTRYFTSANTMKCLLTSIFTYGFDDTLFYATQYLDNPLEDRGYVEMFRDEVARFSTLKRAVKNCEVVGCEIVYDPSSHVLRKYTGGHPSPLGNAWTSIMGRFGIPYTTKTSPDNVKLISGRIVELMSDSEIRSILKGGVFLDSIAAEYLYKKGYGSLIGIEHIERGTEANFSSESIRHPEKYASINGRLMYNFIFSPAGNEGGVFFRIKPMAGSEVVTDFMDTNETAVIPGLVTYENELGGRVGVMAFDLARTSSSTLFNYKKKELVKQIVNWLGRKDLPITIINQPNVFCIFSQSNDNKYGIATITNMTADIYSSVDLEVNSEWRNAKVEFLSADGTWKYCETKAEKIKKVNVVQETLSPIVLRLTKQ